MDLAALALAVVPLMVSALENFEYTFQPILIFSHRYRREVERFQNALKVQRVTFENECCFLLHTVTSNQGLLMIDNHHHPLWQDDELEGRLRDRLSDSYGACLSSLQLVNQLLREILNETGTLEILAQRRHGHPDFGWRDWLTRLRQRSRISFSRDRFDDKLLELQNRIDGLHNIRKHVERISADRSIAEHSTSQISDLTVPLFRVVQVASSSLHEVLSSLWQCGTPNQHFANMALNTKEEMATIEGNTQKVHFDLAWVCPAHMLGGSQIPLWLSIETFSERQTIMPVNHPPALQQRLEAVLGGLPTQQSNPPMASALLVPDLRTVPDLCRYLHSRSPSQPSATCDGFLQQNMTFKHLFYADHNGRAQGQDVKSLEDALKAARSNPECIPLPDKLNLAKLLALAVLRYHSTPWLKSGWGSQDVVFFSNEDFTCDPFPDPFLRSNIETRTSTTNQHLVLSNAGSHTTVTQSRSPIRNQTLYNLGVMLVELAYDSPLKDLQRPEDDQGDSHTLYWTATRLGDVVNRRLGPKYSSAVKICLYGGFGASTELEEAQVQKRFFDEVVLKLVTCAEAVKI